MNGDSISIFSKSLPTYSLHHAADQHTLPQTHSVSKAAQSSSLPTYSRHHAAYNMSRSAPNTMYYSTNLNSDTTRLASRFKKLLDKAPILTHNTVINESTSDNCSNKDLYIEYAILNNDIIERQSLAKLALTMTSNAWKYISSHMKWICNKENTGFTLYMVRKNTISSLHHYYFTLNIRIHYTKVNTALQPVFIQSILSYTNKSIQYDNITPFTIIMTTPDLDKDMFDSLLKLYHTSTAEKHIVTNHTNDVIEQKSIFLQTACSRSYLDSDDDTINHSQVTDIFNHIEPRKNNLSISKNPISTTAPAAVSTEASDTLLWSSYIAMPNAQTSDKDSENESSSLFSNSKWYTEPTSSLKDALRLISASSK